VEDAIKDVCRCRHLAVYRIIGRRVRVPALRILADLAREYRERESSCMTTHDEQWEYDRYSSSRKERSRRNQSYQSFPTSPPYSRRSLPGYQVIAASARTTPGERRANFQRTAGSSFDLPAIAVDVVEYSHF